jgi:hypothetical protein
VIDFLFSLFAPAWPITFEKINLWAPDKKDLILTLRQSRVALSEAPMYPVQLYPISNVMSLKFELQQHLRTISSVQRYLLEWTVQDALSDVSRLINGVEKHTLLPNQLLEVQAIFVVFSLFLEQTVNVSCLDSTLWPAFGRPCCRNLESKC